MSVLIKGLKGSPTVSNKIALIHLRQTGNIKKNWNSLNNNKNIASKFAVTSFIGLQIRRFWNRVVICEDKWILYEN